MVPWKNNITIPSLEKNDHRWSLKRDVVGNLGNLGRDILEAEVDGGLLEVGGQLEGLVKASQTYGQLR